MYYFVSAPKNWVRLIHIEEKSSTSRFSLFIIMFIEYRE